MLGGCTGSHSPFSSARKHKFRKERIDMLSNHRTQYLFASIVFVSLVLAQTAFGTIVTYVDAGASSGGNGLSWSNPLRFPTDAIDYLVQHLGTNEPGEIHIAGGTYYPDRSNASPGGTTVRTDSFRLLKNVTMKGQYRGLSAGTGQNADDRDPSIISYLDGNINSSTSSTDNSYHVV